MARDIQDHVGFLQEAKAALAELEAEKAKSSRLQTEEKKLTRAVAAEKKDVAEEISDTISKRKDEITISYDREITKTQDKLKKARMRREKAKNQGVRSRIDSETAQLREENRQLKLQTATQFHQNGVPSICNTKFYYALYFTKGFKEILILLLTFFIGFFVLPCGIYWLIPIHKLWILVVIYIADIVILCGAYLALNNRSKVEHLELMKDADAVIVADIPFGEANIRNLDGLEHVKGELYIHKNILNQDFTHGQLQRRLDEIQKIKEIHFYEKFNAGDWL